MARKGAGRSPGGLDHGPLRRLRDRLGRRGRRRARRRRSRRRSRGGGIDRADEDLASCRQAAVRRGEHDAQSDDVGVPLERRRRRRALRACRQHGHAAPVGESGTGSRRRGDRLAQRDHVADGGAFAPGGPALGADARGCPQVDAVGRDLPVEDRHGDDVGGGLHARLGARPDRDARRRRADAHNRAVGRVGEGVGAARRGRRSADLGHGRSRLTGDDHLQCEGPARRGRRLGRDRRAGREAQHQQESEDQEQCTGHGRTFGRRLAAPLPTCRLLAPER